MFVCLFVVIKRVSSLIDKNKETTHTEDVVVLFKADEMPTDKKSHMLKNVDKIVHSFALLAQLTEAKNQNSECNYEYLSDFTSGHGPNTAPSPPRSPPDLYVLPPQSALDSKSALSANDDDETAESISKLRNEFIALTTSEYKMPRFLNGYKKENAYMCVKSPSEHAQELTNEFWRMIWKHKVFVIVRVSSLAKDEQRRDSVYWPVNQNESMEFKELRVENLVTDNCEHYRLTRLALMHKQVCFSKIEEQ